MHGANMKIQVYKLERVEWENTSEKRRLVVWKKVILINLNTIFQQRDANTHTHTQQ